MANTQLETLLAESGMDPADRHQVRRIFSVLTQDRQIALLERPRFERVARNIASSREALARERSRVVATLADDLAAALARWNLEHPVQA